jgi:hypothetical protein
MKRWTNEKLEILKKYWNDPTKTYKDVMAETDMNKQSICQKAKTLGLKKIKRYDIKDGYYMCALCDRLLPRDQYEKKEYRCKECKILIRRKVYQQKKESGEIKVKYNISKWTKEQTDILVLYYNDPFKTIKDISYKTGKSKNQIVAKAQNLKLKKARNTNQAPIGHKLCIKCKLPRPKELFKSLSICNICKVIDKTDNNDVRNKDENKTCTKCKEIKNLKDFVKVNNRILSICKKCKNKQTKEYKLKKIQEKGFC